MIQDGVTKNWYFSFRFLQKRWVYDNPTLDFKFLEGWLTNDLKENFHIKIHLPYAFTTYIIDDTQGNKIKDLLNAYGATHHSIVSEAKNGSTSSAAKLLVNKPLLAALNKGVADLEKAKTEAQGKLTEATNQLKGETTQLDAVDKEITDLQSQISTKNNKRSEIVVSMKAISSQIGSYNTTLSSINANGANSDKQKQLLNDEINEAVKRFNGNMTLLKVEAPPRKEEINKAQSAITAMADKNTFVDNLKKIYP